MRITGFLAFVFLLTSAGIGLAQAPAPVSVMIVGDFHMSNPGRDLHDLHADDVLAPKRQREIQNVADALSRFRPTAVAVEWPAALTDTRYVKYLKGEYGAKSRNEVVQLGFRLAKQAGLDRVHGIDVEGEFPYEAVRAFAHSHGMDGLLAKLDRQVVAEVAGEQAALGRGTIADELRYLNTPSRIAGGNAFYSEMLHFGEGAKQPGAELLADWHKRNLYICARLVQLARPGDRVVAFFGSGHAFLLRQCVSQVPGFTLVEASGYLPR